jgi:transposase
MRWRDALTRGGPQALRPKPAPGRPPLLTDAQKTRLVTYLVRGPLAHGYRTDLWTTLRVAQVIQRKFGVAGKILHDLDWTCQKPETRATQRDEAAIEAWDNASALRD